MTSAQIPRRTKEERRPEAQGVPPRSIRIPVEALPLGTVARGPLYDPAGRLLLAQGAAVTETLRELLHRRDVTEVFQGPRQPAQTGSPSPTFRLPASPEEGNRATPSEAAAELTRSFPSGVLPSEPPPEAVVQPSAVASAAGDEQKEPSPAEPTLDGLTDADAAAWRVLDELDRRAAAGCEAESRRRRSRRSFRSTLDVASGGGPPVRVWARNLSETGLSFVHPGPIGAAVVTLTLGQNTLEAEVVRCRPAADGFWEHGVKFLRRADRSAAAAS